MVEDNRDLPGQFAAGRDDGLGGWKGNAQITTDSLSTEVRVAKADRWNPPGL